MSRRESIQDKRKSRNGLLMLFSAIGLFVLLIFVGIKYAAQVALFAERFRKDEVSLKDDKTPPGPPRLDTKLPEYTNQETHTLEGYAEAGSLVKIYRNDSVVGESLVGDDSKFSIEMRLEKGANSIWPTATDQAGNEGPRPNTWVVNFDNEAPAIEVQEPEENATVNEKSITIKGTTEMGSQITANERLGTVDQEGNFTVKLTLNEGENTVKIIAVDKAENKSEKELVITYEQ